MLCICYRQTDNQNLHTSPITLRGGNRNGWRIVTTKWCITTYIYSYWPSSTGIYWHKIQTKENKILKRILLRKQSLCWSGNVPRQNIDSTKTSKIRSTLVPYISPPPFTVSDRSYYFQTFILTYSNRSRPKGSQNF